jgi:hypothetical protein
LSKGLSLTKRKKLTINSITSRKPRHETFDERDIAYLDSKPNVELSEKINEGSYGQFYKIQGNNNLGVKMPFCTLNKAGGTHSCSDCSDKRYIIEEGRKCKDLRFNDRPMLAPTRMKQIIRDGNKCVGLIRPLVNEVKGAQEETLTDAQLETLRTKLIALSRQGIVLDDGLQFGFTPSGRLMQFDLDRVNHTYVSAAFYQNDELWRTMLALAGKLSHCRQLPFSQKIRCQDAVFEKYGRVSPR